MPVLDEGDPDECRVCYHDRSFHTPECDECFSEAQADTEPDELCTEFVD